MIVDRVYNCVSNCGCADDLKIYDNYLARHPALQMATVCSLDQVHWSIDVEQSPVVESMKDRVYLAGFDSMPGQMHIRHHLAIAKDRIHLAGFDSPWFDSPTHSSPWSRVNTQMMTSLPSPSTPSSLPLIDRVCVAKACPGRDTNSLLRLCEC